MDSECFSVKVIDTVYSVLSGQMIYFLPDVGSRLAAIPLDEVFTASYRVCTKVGENYTGECLIRRRRNGLKGTELFIALLPKEDVPGISPTSSLVISNLLLKGASK